LSHCYHCPCRSIVHSRWGPDCVLVKQIITVGRKEGGGSRVPLGMLLHGPPVILLLSWRGKGVGIMSASESCTGLKSWSVESRWAIAAMYLTSTLLHGPHIALPSSGSGTTTVVTEYRGSMTAGGGTTRTGSPSSIAISPSKSSPGGAREYQTLFVHMQTCLCRCTGMGNAIISKSSSLSSTTGNNRGDTICSLGDDAARGAAVSRTGPVKQEDNTYHSPCMWRAAMLRCATCQRGTLGSG
jgi:hypothetical protein